MNANTVVPDRLNPMALLLLGLAIAQGPAQAKDAEATRRDEIRQYIARHLDQPHVVTAAAAAYCRRHDPRKKTPACEEEAKEVARAQRLGLVVHLITESRRRIQQLETMLDADLPVPPNPHDLQNPATDACNDQEFNRVVLKLLSSIRQLEARVAAEEKRFEENLGENQRLNEEFQQLSRERPANGIILENESSLKGREASQENPAERFRVPGRT